jgi:DNA-binding NtrC family response regulator
VTRVLVVEPDPALGRLIQEACGDQVHVIACRDFHCAREHLMTGLFDRLITNLRLRDYNGLHLVLLAQAERSGIRAVVHTDRSDPYLIREARAIGAFFEASDRLPQALAAYLSAPLPQSDRRDAEHVDRRMVFRGGRRSADRPVHL